MAENKRILDCIECGSKQFYLAKDIELTIPNGINLANNNTIGIFCAYCTRIYFVDVKPNKEIERYLTLLEQRGMLHG